MRAPCSLDRFGPSPLRCRSPLTSGNQTLAVYAVIDPTFSLRAPSTFDNPCTAERAQALVRYLTHSFRPFELLSASPAADTPIAELLDSIEDLIKLTGYLP